MSKLQSVITMLENTLQWSIQPLIAVVQLSNSLFLTALPMVLKERCMNATRDPALNFTSATSWQSTVSSIYMTIKVLCQLIPIVPGLFLARLGDKGWRKIPIVMPLIGFMLARLVMLLMLALDWPLEVLWLEATITGLCGGFTVFWGGTMTLLSLSSTQQDRSRLMMTAELTNAIAGVLGCMAAGHLFNASAAGSIPGLMTMVVSLLLYALCVLYIIFFLQVHTSSKCKQQQEVERRTMSGQVVNIVLLWLAGILYSGAVSAARNILILFELMEPLHWSVTQVGYGDAFGFLIILSSFLSAMILSRWASDFTLITLGMLSYTAGTTLMAFVTNTYMFYIARTLSLFSLMPTPIIQSLLSQQVHGSLYGIVLTSLQLSLRMSSVVHIPLYTHIYQHTLNWFPGFVFIISGIIAIAAIIPIRILASGLVAQCCYLQFSEDEEGDTDDTLPLTSGCSDDINQCDD